MSMFRSDIKMTVAIEGCPLKGLPALDWRRERGLPDRLDNRHEIAVVGDVSEEAFRALVGAGWSASSWRPDGSHCICMAGLRCEFSPELGYIATIPVAATDEPHALAARALVAARRAQRESDIGAPALREERATLVARIAEIDAQLASI
jgi:hypothetical protein